MSWQDDLGNFGRYIGDVTGWTDVADEYSAAKADGSISAGEWAKVIWQGGQVPTETLFAAPFRAVFDAYDAYAKNALEPTLSWIALSTIGATQWKNQGESYSQYLSRVNAATYGATGDDVDPNQRITVGEALTSARGIGMGGIPGLITALGTTGESFDPFSPEDQKRLHEDKFTGRMAGYNDFAVPMVMDPINFIGAPTKAVMAGWRGARLVSDGVYESANFLSRRGMMTEQGVRDALASGQWQKATDDIAEMADITEAMDWANRSNLGITDPASFARLATRVQGGEDADRLLRVLYLGDQEAISALESTYGKGYSLTLKNAVQDDTHISRALSSGSDVIDDPDVLDGIAELMDEADQMETFQRALAKFSDPARPNVARALPNENSFVGARRAAGVRKGAERSKMGITEAATPRSAKLIPFRPYPAHPATWFMERGAGVVNPHEADSYKEIAAQIRELDFITQGGMSKPQILEDGTEGSSLGNYIMEEWANASSHASPESARGLVAHKLNEVSIGLMADKYGLSTEAARTLFEQGTAKATKHLEQARQRGFLSAVLDNGSMGVVRSPVLQRTTPNSVQLWDFRMIDKHFKKMEGTGYEKVLNNVFTEGVHDATEFVNSVFKMSVLMRLGYTLRNLTEATWSIAATGNLGHVIGAVGPERVSTLMNKARVPAARLIDRVGMSTGLRDDPEAVWRALQEKVAMLEGISAMTDEVANRIGYANMDVLAAENPALHASMQRARTLLTEEATTFHGTTSPDWALDDSRWLSTTESQVMALKEADKVWEDFQVAAFSDTGTREGLLSPHPDIGRNVYGRRGAQYHGTPVKWEGDIADPDLRRGDLKPDPDYWEDASLVGAGHYSTDSLEMAGTYEQGGRNWGRPDPNAQTYTTVWNKFMPPKLFDADQPLRDAEVVNDFLVDFENDMNDLADVFDTAGDFTFAEGWRDTIGRSLDEVTDAPRFTSANAETFAKTADNFLRNHYMKMPGSGVDTPEQFLAATYDLVQPDSPILPNQRALMKIIRQQVMDGEDPETIGRVIDMLGETDTLAYNWYTPGPTGPEFTRAPGEALTETLLTNFVTGQQDKATDPAVKRFFRDWFDLDAEEFLSDMVDSAGSVDSLISDLYELGPKLMNRAFTKRLRENGFDAIAHTGGLNQTTGQTHRVQVFLNADDVRVVGRDWMDYDNAKILDASRGMALDLLKRMDDGASVRMLVRDVGAAPGVKATDLPGARKYRDVTRDEVESWVSDPVALTRKFGYNPKNRTPLDEATFKKTFQVLPKEHAPQAIPVTSYGREANFASRQWKDVPEDMRQAMGWKARRGAGGTLKRGKRSFSDDMNAMLRGDQEVTRKVMEVADSLGYARVALPDKKAYGGVQVIVNPKSVGNEGLKRRVQSEVDKRVARVEATGAGVQDRTRAVRRGERKTYRATRNSDPLPINPDYDTAMAKAMGANGIEDWIEQVGANKRMLEEQVDQLSALHTDAVARRARVEGKDRLGFLQGDVAIPSRYGTDYTVAGPLGGHAGTQWAKMTSSDGTNQTLFMPAANMAKVSGSGVPSEVAVDSPKYFTAWANAINMHFRDPESMIADPVAKMFADGDTIEDVVKWATGTKEGADWAYSIGISQSSTAGIRGRGAVAARQEAIAEARAVAGASRNIDPEDIEQAVASLQMAVDLYLPEGPIRQAYRNGEPIVESMLRKAVPPEQRQPIHGLLFPTSREARAEWKAQDYVSAGATKLMRALGTLPETAVARHPLFGTLALGEYKNRIAIAEERLNRRLTVEEINQIVHDSRQAAKSDMEKTLFTMTRRSRASSTTTARLAFPFMSAWENSLRRWGNFAKADPSMPIRAAGLITKVMNSLPIVASDGETLDRISSETSTGATFGWDSYIVLPVEDITKFIPGKVGQQIRNTTKDIKVGVKSLDIVSQGEPMNPGIGPFALLPVYEVLKRRPSMEKFLGWTMPYGMPQGELDLFMPAAAKRAKSYFMKDSNYTNAFAAAYLTETWKYENGQRDTAPTMKEIEDQTASYFLLRFLTNLTAPVSVQYTNERDWYVSKMRAYRDIYPDSREADARFFADYPDASTLVQSLSSNPAGLSATYQTQENLSDYQQEVAQAYAMGDPQLAGFIGNYDSRYGNVYDNPDEEFSRAVYSWERNNSAVPGSNDMYRGVANPEDSVREAKIDEGWRTYFQIQNQALAKLQSAGVPPDSPGHAKAMAAVKTAAATAIFDTGNNDWWNEYKNPDTSKYFRRAQYFEEITQNSKFMADHGGDPLMQSISMYLQARRQMAVALDANAQNGGARTLGAQANAAAKAKWDAWVAQMKADSPEFSAWVDRYFGNDPVVGGAPLGRAA